MDSNLVTNILESAKGKLAKPVTKKEPITVELLTKMYPRLFCDCHVKNHLCMFDWICWIVSK